MRLPNGMTATVMWDAPQRGLIAARNGVDMRPGWTAELHCALRGHPDVQIGKASAPDRLTLQLVKAWGLVYVWWKLRHLVIDGGAS